MVSATGVVAIIPARGGSKSIPRKNVRAFAGHPLLAWSIAAARQAAVVDRVIVSTDDEEIRDVALRHGAEVPFRRPAELAQDDTPDAPVFLHALHWLASVDGYEPELIVQLRPTSPLRPRGLVEAAVAAMRGDHEADSLRAVAHAAQNPYKMWRGGRPYLEPLLAHDCPEPYNMPRQRLPATYWQTGQVDVIRRDTLLRARSMTGHRILPIEVDAELAVDLDTPDQWAQAEWLAERRRRDICAPTAPSGTPPADLARYRLLVLDFDGVLTDNRVYVDETGRETVACDRSDGLGLAALGRAGLPIVVLSTEVNPVVTARCAKLRLPCRQGLADKGAALREVAAAHGVALEQLIYVGNDVNDMECLRLAGLAVVPADAHPAVRSTAHWILTRLGGCGAVRELCDAILQTRAS